MEYQRLANEIEDDGASIQLKIEMLRLISQNIRIIENELLHLPSD